MSHFKFFLASLVLGLVFACGLPSAEAGVRPVNITFHQNAQAPTSPLQVRRALESHYHPITQTGFASSTQAGSVKIARIPSLNGTPPDITFPEAISADGKTVIGSDRGIDAFEYDIASGKSKIPSTHFDVLSFDSLNASGFAAGLYQPYYGSPNAQAGVMKNGVVMKLNFSLANAINAAGEVVGYNYVPATGAVYPVAYLRGRVYALPGFPQGGSAAANAVNTQGDIVGFSVEPPASQLCSWVWFAGHAAPTYFGCVAQGQFVSTASYAFGINDSQQVVGFYDVIINPVSAIAHAYIWHAGHLMDLNKLDPHPSSGSAAYGINNHGLVVGVDSTGAFVYDPCHAKLGLQNLNLLLPHNSGWTLLDAVAISEDGKVIIGNGNPPGGGSNVTGYVMTLQKPL